MISVVSAVWITYQREKVRTMKSPEDLQREFNDLCEFILRGTDANNYEARVRAVRRLPTVIDLLAGHNKLTPEMLIIGQKAIAAVH